jgi:hypothetical protein
VSLLRDKTHLNLNLGRKLIMRARGVFNSRQKRWCHQATIGLVAVRQRVFSSACTEQWGRRIFAAPAASNGSDFVSGMALATGNCFRKHWKDWRLAPCRSRGIA